MIDNLSILFSTVLVVYVLVRAAVLDRQRPWFDKAADADKRPAPAPRHWS